MKVGLSGFSSNSNKPRIGSGIWILLVHNDLGSIFFLCLFVFAGCCLRRVNESVPVEVMLGNQIVMYIIFHRFCTICTFGVNYGSISTEGIFYSYEFFSGIILQCDVLLQIKHFWYSKQKFLTKIQTLTDLI